MRTDKQRRRLRKIIMFALVPVALTAIVFASKFIAIGAFADASADAFDRRSWTESTTQAEPLNIWNFVETWKAPFDQAVGLGMRGDAADLEQARALLEQALEMHGDPTHADYCVIYTNIVYVIEKQGDLARAGDDQQAANGLYQEALDLIAAAPEGCLEEPDAGEPNTQEQLNESVPRIEEKIVQEDGGGGDEGDEGEGGEGDESDGESSDDGEPQTPQEQLEEQNQQSQQQQQQQGNYDPEPGDNEGEGGIDSPW